MIQDTLMTVILVAVIGLVLGIAQGLEMLELGTADLFGTLER